MKRSGSEWGWRPGRLQGVWRHGALWLRPFVAAAPWVTVGILILQFGVLGLTLSSARGVLFDLPSTSLQQEELTEMVAVAMPVGRETLVFFDDSRFRLGDEASLASLADQLADRVARSKRKSLLVLADRRVPGGELMRLSEVARQSGVARILFAEKKGEDPR